MTKRIFFLQFFTILLIFVLPPIFAGNAPAEPVDLGRPNYFALVNLCAAIFLLAQKRMLERPKGAASQTEARPKDAAAAKTMERQKRAEALCRAAIFGGRVLACYGSLLLLGISFYLAQKLFKAQAAAVALPDGLSGALICAFSLFVSALYEETLYRWYLPGALKTAASQRSGAEPEESPRSGEPETVASQKGGAEAWKARLFFWGTEAACAALFALAHRWQGALAVLNAFIGGTILRVCAAKAKSLKPGIAAHFFYNASALLFTIF